MSQLSVGNDGNGEDGKENAGEKKKGKKKYVWIEGEVEAECKLKN